jgi:hypothetical protein
MTLHDILYGLFAEVAWGAVGCVAAGAGTWIAFDHTNWQPGEGTGALVILLISAAIGGGVSAAAALVLQLLKVATGLRISLLVSLNLAILALVALFHPTRIHSQRPRRSD